MISNQKKLNIDLHCLDGICWLLNVLLFILVLYEPLSDCVFNDNSLIDILSFKLIFSDFKLFNSLFKSSLSITNLSISYLLEFNSLINFSLFCLNSSIIIVFDSNLFLKRVKFTKMSFYCSLSIFYLNINSWFFDSELFIF